MTTTTLENSTTISTAASRLPKVGIAVYQTMEPGAYGPGVNIGWPPRLAFFTYMVWVVILGWQAINCSQQNSDQ